MASGKCGKNLTWTLNGGILTISGNGKMDRYSLNVERRPAPWYKNFVEKIIIEDGVTTIGKAAFNFCKSLTEIKIPDSVIEIGSRAFYNCSSLTEIKIPDGVTEIGDSAFGYCSSLKEIKIPDGVTEIGLSAFWGCGSLTEIKISDGVTEIGSGAFNYCSSLTEIKIPDGVTEIGDSAFHACGSLKEIKIPDGVTEIGYSAFHACGSLKEIKIPDGVTEIGDSAFYACSSLKEITIPYGLKKLGDEVLDGCTSLEKIYYRAGSDFEDILSEGNNATLIPVEKLNWKVEGSTLTVGGVREIKDYSQEKPPWVDSLEDIQRIVIEEGVEKISANAFAACHRLEHLIIPASVKTIGDFAFAFCYCGDRRIDGGKNVIWSLDDGILMIKKNPAAKSDADFSTGYEMWNVAEKNIKGVKIERGVIPSKQFFDWLAKMGDNVSVQIA